MERDALMHATLDLWSLGCDFYGHWKYWFDLIKFRIVSFVREVCQVMHMEKLSFANHLN